ncbi:aldehyde dehydrogenase family protein [Mycobacterium aquaticum]|uniref:Aldehyde dehydrogenase n=1 Tax=Mycobacterium aquaticum TaxID=1927124 RepID=A0A1X0AVB9_9MYCO|nr:aldehyde dehydrogenase family protein [Mycobacterium aquaticum]ORA33990.1 aldehyde dehydrogenase [Mycobacterium aquaticum]
MTIPKNSSATAAPYQPRGLLVDGVWIAPGATNTLYSPYDGAAIAEVPQGNSDTVDRAVAAAKLALDADGFERHTRIDLLDAAVEQLRARQEDFAQTIAIECAKPIKTARLEAARTVDTFAFAAAEARTFAGDVVALDAVASGRGKVAYTMRVPIGVVAAVAPFNFPLNLVAHKVAPAIAVGCPVVLKPASQTPLSALLLAEMLTDIGLPPGWLNVVTGGGAEVGGPLCAHPDVSYITFTGSPDVGWGIAARAPKKRVRLELGSNAPLIVDCDSDWQTAAAKAATAGFVQAGQSCVSTQRIFVHADIASGFREALAAGVSQLTIGDPLSEDVDVSAVISRKDALRIESWVNEAVSEGARLDIGGERIDNVIVPAVLSNVTPDMRVQCDEVFGPVVTVTEFDDFDTALEMANDSRFGLNAGVYTSNVAKALKATRRLEFGSVYINDVPTVRADQQPYGGGKDSGNTREGPRYAMAEMTEPRLVTMQ